MCVTERCICEGDFYGDACQHRRCIDDCSGHGYCYQGSRACSQGWRGVTCNEIIEQGDVVTLKMYQMDPKNAPSPIDVTREVATLRKIPHPGCPGNCNGHGTCNPGGDCHCNPGYSGASCSAFCPNECAHNGQCIEGACLCFAGFIGVDCSISGCCSGHGSCEDDPSECKCDGGWGGADCSIKIMCPDMLCSGHGACVNGQCKCMPGFVGEDCSIEQKDCPGHCNNKGLCMNGKCMCGPGWSSDDCSVPFIEPGSPTPTSAQKKAKKAAEDDATGGGGG